jgi:hypothetical protein
VQMGPPADAARLRTAASCHHGRVHRVFAERYEGTGRAGSGIAAGAGSVTALTGPRAGTGNGGIPARRAVFRWGWRLFRREWRQQLLVLGLLTVA